MAEKTCAYACRIACFVLSLRCTNTVVHYRSIIKTIENHDRSKQHLFQVSREQASRVHRFQCQHGPGACLRAAGQERHGTSRRFFISWPDCCAPPGRAAFVSMASRHQKGVPTCSARCLSCPKNSSCPTSPSMPTCASTPRSTRASAARCSTPALPTSSCPAGCGSASCRWGRRKRCT